MESENVTVRALARHACDHCRSKKIRCSRELPKCAACRPWSSACRYSEIRKPAKRIEPKRTESRQLPPIHASPSIVDERLDRIEAAIANLVTSVSQGIGPRPSDTESGKILAKNNHKKLRLSGSVRSAPPKPPPAVHGRQLLATLDKAAQDLRSIYGEMPEGAEVVQVSAENALKDLSASLTTASLAGTPGRDAAITTTTSYFTPSLAIGYDMIGKFWRIMDLADVLMRRPSDEVVRTVVFEPDSIADPGWIVIVNHLILGAILADEPDQRLAQSLQQNVRLALDDARLFLEPDIVHIQALVLLACHGDDYASPNISWMLMGHACRQAQALGLNLLKDADYTDEQRNLSMFWSLFCVDKSCSLAFGRPMLLSTDMYENVPLPDFAHLQRHQPHRVQLPISQESAFGAHFFMRNIEFAKLTGYVLQSAVGSVSAPLDVKLVAKLEEWDKKTRELLQGALDTELPKATSAHVQEMTLGMSVMRFQYLHVMLLLLPNDSMNKPRQVQYAREAIHLLGGMVSNSNQVYNGVVWQLLYYPFTAFLTIFGNIAAEPCASTAEQDLHHLESAVLYYSRMAQNLHGLSPLSRKLEHTAQAFLNLSEFIVSRGQGTSATTPTDAKLSDVGSEKKDILPLPSAVISENMEIYGEEFDSYLQSQNDVDLAQREIGIGNLLECFGNDDAGELGRKRSFGSSFDWFLWDSNFCIE